MSEQIEVTIKPDGTTTVEAKGVVGKGCTALTAAIENAIGKTTGTTLKPEFNQTPKVAAKAKAGQ